MFRINIIYDNTIDNKDVPEVVRIMPINCGKNIGSLLENQKIEDFTTPFVSNIVFRNTIFFKSLSQIKN